MKVGENMPKTPMALIEQIPESQALDKHVQDPAVILRLGCLTCPFAVYIALHGETSPMPFNARYPGEVSEIRRIAATVPRWLIKAGDTELEHGEPCQDISVSAPPTACSQIEQMRSAAQRVNQVFGEIMERPMESPDSWR